MVNTEGLEYKRTGYDSRARKYIVYEYKNGVPLYEYRCKVNGNEATLYPYRRILATENKTRTLKMSIFDIRRK